jgi:hypothetical protein
VTFRVPFDDQAAAITAIDEVRRNELAAAIEYTDVRGKQRGRTRFWVMKHPDEESQIEYVVDRIELFRGARETPFASPSGRGVAPSPGAPRR